ncbi:MAG: ATPase [Bacteroidales bacterium]|nr:ATPase [Bacteroidales bacterium]
MILIVDSGSTKMEWILVEGDAVNLRFFTDGFNPNYSPIRRLETLMETQGIASLQREVESIHYYGTGCGNDNNCQKIKEVFQDHFPNADIHVTHDLMAACHALLGHEEGIACILGTGSNSCVFDGENITERAVSLGYLLGDEGSGMHIGREVVKAYFYGFMPEDLRQLFDETFHLELKDFIQHLYHDDQPSKYLASFARFAGEHQDYPFIHTLVRNCFDDFTKASLLRYKNCKSMKIGFVGSVAYYFHDILKECLEACGLTMGLVRQAPADGLVAYHLQRASISSSLFSI